MKQLHNLSEALPLFKCLGSEIRVAILEMLSQNGSMQMREIADRLKITSGSLSPHIRMLEENELISIQMSPGKHGVQKVCSLCEDKLIIDFENTVTENNIYEAEIGVGQYSDYKIFPTCGLSTSRSLIGSEDDPRFFGSPERVNAGILWFTRGYIEYLIPNFLEEEQILKELLISFEIASEAPGTCEDWPSDIGFSINGVELCRWVSPGDYGKNPGIYNPEWWDPNWNQYGLLKFLSVNESGTYIDGVKQTDVSIQDLDIRPGNLIRFRFSAMEENERFGGLTLFGRSFGNYDQDIKVRMKFQGEV